MKLPRSKREAVVTQDDLLAAINTAIDQSEKIDMAETFTEAQKERLREVPSFATRICVGDFGKKHGAKCPATLAGYWDVKTQQITSVSARLLGFFAVAFDNNMRGRGYADDEYRVVA